jgi:hypothetical protein
VLPVPAVLVANDAEGGQGAGDRALDYRGFGIPAVEQALDKVDGVADVAEGQDEVPSRSGGWHGQQTGSG